MTFDQIPAGAAVFLDANSLVYHFTNDPKYGVASTRLVHQIEHGSSVRLHLHRRPGGCRSSLDDPRGDRRERLALRRDRGTAAQTSSLHPEVDHFSAGDRLFAPTEHSGDCHDATAPGSCDPREPAVRTPHRRRPVVAVMQAHGLTHLASNDADFDRVPWLTRYEPI